MFRLSETGKYCLTLPIRVDRQKNMINEFHKHHLRVRFFYGIDASALIVPELYPKKSEYNAAAIQACARSHISLLHQAYEDGCDYAMVLEDDVELSANWDKAMDNLEGCGFDLLYLGGHSTIEPKDAGGGFYVAGNIAGTYGFIVNRNIIPYILRNYCYFWGMDEFLSMYIQPNFNCFILLPTLVKHLDGYSDVALHHVEYNCNKWFDG